MLKPLSSLKHFRFSHILILCGFMILPLWWRLGENWLLTRRLEEKWMNRLETELRCAPSLSSFLVQGFSMRGLLRSGEQVWVDQNYYTCHPVVRGDLVIVQVPRRERTLIKSIQALPGDEISLVPAPQGAGFMLLVNREPVQAASGGKPYFFTQARSEVLAAGLDQGKLPEGRYLVLGTLPGGTTDSSEFGSIPLDWIQGRVVRTGNRILTH